MTIGYLQRGVFTAGGERASLSIRASIRCYPPATEQYADFADRRIYPRMLRIAADLPADYADFTNGFWGVQIDGFFGGLVEGRHWPTYGSELRSISTSGRMPCELFLIWVSLII